MTMTMARTSATTTTYERIEHVTRKVRADLFAVVDSYGYFQEGYATNLITDVRTFLDEEALDNVQFIWLRRGTQTVMEEFRYVVLADGTGRVDARSGGVLYRPELKEADFRVRVTYSARWLRMSEAERSAIRKRLVLTWGPAGQLDYTGGRWVSDRTYAKDGYALERRQFTR